ncbi:MAG: formate dehydrogenase accessory protein FdhE [Candidatus Acidiferrum sp.]
MTLLFTGKINYRSRIERAALLGERFSFAQQILGFYGRVAEFQKEFYQQLPKLWGKSPVAPAGGNLRSELNLDILLEPFGRFLSVIESNGPGPLSEGSRHLRSQGETAWANALTDFWKTGMLEAASSEPLTEFLARAFLQPYAEFVSGAQLPPVLTMTVCRCPHCNSLPLLGVMRREGDGGKRFLQCSFCSQEWDFRRIFCAYCGEDQEQKLSVYIAEQFPAQRVECCDTCKHFLRTIDLTKDGNAVPLVDDLAAIPLSLWAQEKGYSRIQGNLLGT